MRNFDSELMALDRLPLVPNDVATMKPDVRMNGDFLEGEASDQVDPMSGAKQLDWIEDERQFDGSK